MAEGFVIRLEDTSESTSSPVSASPGFVDMSEADSLFQRILAKAKELLTDNLPPWDTVEAAVRAAYDLYIRPLSIPNFLDNVLANALVREVKKLYDDLA